MVCCRQSLLLVGMGNLARWSGSSLRVVRAYRHAGRSCFVLSGNQSHGSMHGYDVVQGVGLLCVFVGDGEQKR